MTACPVCQSELKKVEKYGEQFCYDCPRCGPYSLSREANDDLAGWLHHNEGGGPLLSHALYKMTKGRADWPMLTNELVENILKNSVLPTPQEQLDNFITWVGGAQKSPGEEVEITAQTEAAIGALDVLGAGFVITYAVSQGLVNGNVTRFLDGSYGFGTFQLTFPGWSYLADLQRSMPNSRMAFMAMKFGDDETDMLFREHFKAAVKATGFELRRLDEEPRAGLIDDRLRVEIRQSRFLIADLTHANPGAYWEAGFAEGLDKPVIFTCRKSVFDDPKTRPHFDTNHHLTVVWDPSNLGEAIEMLKATIRATMPGEAKLND